MIMVRRYINLYGGGEGVECGAEVKSLVELFDQECLLTVSMV